MARQTVVVSVRMTPKLYRDLRRAALRDRRTLSDFSRLVLEGAADSAAAAACRDRTPPVRTSSPDAAPRSARSEIARRA